MPAIRYLILWPTAACNLDCGYCYRRLRGGGAMPWPTAAAALELAAGPAAETGRPFHVQLAGGEPTLVPDLVEQVVTELRQRRSPATIGIQTNATRLSPALLQVLLAHQVAVGVSVDGPPPVQERLRGKAAETFQGLALLRDAGIATTVTAVVTAASASRLGDLAVALSAFPNIRGLALDPLVGLGSAAGRGDLIPSGPALAGGVRDLYHRLQRLRPLRQTPLAWRELDRVRRALAHPTNGEPPASGGEPPVNGRAGADYCHACRGESLAVVPDGTCYPCSQAVGDPNLAAGNIHDPAGIDWDRLRRAYTGYRLRGPCGGCPLRGRCPGDCPSRLSSTPAPAGEEAAMCVIYRTLAELETS